jgi:hypothetical protein
MQPLSAEQTEKLLGEPALQGLFSRTSAAASPTDASATNGDG